MTNPLIPIQNVYYMFCYAWGRFEEARAFSTGAEESPDLSNLLARVLSTGTRALLRRGLDRGYLPLEEELSTIRGHIELGATLRLQCRNVRRVTCTFDELSHDLLHNQLLRASLRLLSQARTMEPTLSHELRSLAVRMGDVSEVRLSQAAFARVQLHRNNAQYDLLLKICRLAFECLIPAERGKGYAFQEVLRDERKMARVFEDFVRNYYRASQKAYSVKPLQFEWKAAPIAGDEQVRLPLMRADVYLQSAKRRIILDTKYYAEMLQERHGSASFRSENLYQLFAYLQNDAAWNPELATAEGILLYPEVKQSLDATYDVHGHSVRLVTIDLARPWQEIEERLSSLIV
ncbi:5-methylcytosine-specific restriction endonuclease system specificity protein McrC [Sphingomonadaceae bacterium OTU29THOMA1]|nr:5-methylcytosine-specific restriction endonuclease system specificity protein McrC [Sphingomonadaceae bacterium OTU29THOMA1]